LAWDTSRVHPKNLVASDKVLEERPKAATGYEQTDGEETGTG